MKHRYLWVLKAHILHQFVSENIYFAFGFQARMIEIINNNTNLTIKASRKFFIKYISEFLNEKYNC